MPNGRTHIFEVETAKLLEFLELIQSHDSIGSLFHSGTGTDVHVSLSDLRANLLQHSEPRITIEEQHWCEYIIHVGKSHTGWVEIHRNSPAFPTVRRLHLDHRLPRGQG